MDDRDEVSFNREFVRRGKFRLVDVEKVGKPEGERDGREKKLNAAVKGTGKERVVSIGERLRVEREKAEPKTRTATKKGNN